MRQPRPWPCRLWPALPVHPRQRARRPRRAPGASVAGSHAPARPGLPVAGARAVARPNLQQRTHQLWPRAPRLSVRHAPRGRARGADVAQPDTGRGAAQLARQSLQCGGGLRDAGRVPGRGRAAHQNAWLGRAQRQQRRGRRRQVADAAADSRSGAGRQGRQLWQQRVRGHRSAAWARPPHRARHDAGARPPCLQALVVLVGAPRLSVRSWRAPPPRGLLGRAHGSSRLAATARWARCCAARRGVRSCLPRVRTSPAGRTRRAGLMRVNARRRRQTRPATSSPRPSSSTLTPWTLPRPPSARRRRPPGRALPRRRPRRTRTSPCMTSRFSAPCQGLCPDAWQGGATPGSCLPVEGAALVCGWDRPTATWAAPTQPIAEPHAPCSAGEMSASSPSRESLKCAHSARPALAPRPAQHAAAALGRASSGARVDAPHGSAALMSFDEGVQL